MCGICGWVGSTTSDAPALLDRMTDALSHRGPDDRGTWHLRDEVHLGHRRLAIIDPSPAGRQPMTAGPVTVVLNGEIYNYESLRARLRDSGRTFETGSDTEVLLQGYLHWGLDDLLARLDGMFAFALWDDTDRRLIIARDRMGEKPLYYTEIGGTLIFGSELRALIVHPDVPRDIDSVSLRKYLAYDYIPAPRAMLRGVKKLEAGHMLVWEAGKSAVRRYWDMPSPAAPISDPGAAAGALWEAIRSGVESRLVSDVPVGLFLSGGLDSTAVVVAASELRNPAELPTFCIGFDDPSFDESTHAGAVARHLGTQHHQERLTADVLLSMIPEIVGGLDEPLADPSLIPTHLLARFTRGHVKVALGGDGGDELLLGYPTFGAHRIAQAAAAVPRPLRRALIEPFVRALPVSDANWSLDYRLKRFVAGLDYPPLARHFAWIGGLLPHEHADLLEPSIYAAAHAADPYDDLARLTGRWSRPEDPLDLLTYVYARMYLSEGVLQKVDRATMAHGLESRAPLLSQDVVAACARIPAGLKLRRGTTKWILRHALRGKVPDAIIDRPKKGFGVPLTAWLKGPLLPLCRELLDPAELRGQAIFKAEACERLIKEHCEGWKDNRKVLWALMVFQLWHRSAME